MAAGPVSVPALTRFALAALLVGASPAPAPVPSPTPLVIRVDGGPSGLAFTHDGRTMIVGFEGRFGVGGGIAAYRRNGDAFAEFARARTTMPVEAVALTPDDRTIVATTRVGLAVIDVSALTEGKTKPLELRDGPAPDAARIVVSPDGRTAFYTLQRSSMLGVARLGRSANGSPSLEILNHVPVDHAPSGLAQSTDGRTLYVASEVGSIDAGRVAGAKDSRLGRTRCDVNRGPHGVLSVVDAVKAETDPAHAVVSRVAAGCAPTRVALSPDGSVAWVTARGDNRVLAFDTAELIKNPGEALLASVSVGDVPVGLAVSLDGKHLLVANSHRSRDADQMRDASLTLIDTASALSGRASLSATLPAGALAREVVVAPDGKFYVTNYLARTIQVEPI